jgi:fumarate hydratase subunit alpha
LREIAASQVTEAVARLCQQAAFVLPEDVLSALHAAVQAEESPLGREALAQLIENARLAESERIPVCQDCGTATVFIELGQDVHILRGDLSAAVQAGVRQGYNEAYLRKSQVGSPFSERKNTGDNTPAIVHLEIVPGDRLRLMVMLKGGGSENMTRLFMLTPSSGRFGVIESVVRAVDEAGSNPCPPIVVGVGVGGSAEHALLMAKKAFLRRVGQASPDPENAALEKVLLERINRLGIGPQGFGGRVTALAVHVESAPSHLASLPVAVQLMCHAARRAEVTL